MPRYSERRAAIRRLEEALAAREEAAAARFYYGEEDELEDEMDEFVRAQLDHVLSTCYLVRPPKYRKRADRWQLLLNNRQLNDREVLEHFRVSRSAFRRICDLLRDDYALQYGPRRTFRGPVELHLMFLLKYMGSSGNENTDSKLALFFGFGKGATKNYVDRAARVLLKLTNVVITWPDAAERKEIAVRIQDKYTFPNCVGVINGTLLPLVTKPEKNGEEYFCRKGGYAIQGLITCDDVARIRHVVVGWPGFVHDNRAWSNSDLKNESTKFFAPNEYLLGDSAFQASPHMVPAYKKPPKHDMPEHKKHSTPSSQK